MRSKNVWIAFKQHIGALWPRRIIALVIVAATIIGLFGLSFEKGPTQNIPVDVVNMDGAKSDSIASSVINMVSSGTTVHIVNAYEPSDGDALKDSLDDLKKGEVEAVIVFGSNFTADVQSWLISARNGTTIAPSSLTMYSDSSNPIASAAIQADVQRSVQTVLVTTYHLSSPVKVVNNVVYGGDTDMRDFVAPAIAGLLVFILTLMPTLLANMNGAGKVTDQFSSGERMVAQGLSSFCVGVVLAITILAVLSAFQVRMAGDITVTVVLLAMLALASASLGQLLASITRGHRESAMVIFPLVLYPAILLGGIILPITSIPAYLLPVSYLFPLTYSIDGVRQAMLNGFGWDLCWVQVAALILYTATCMTVAWFAERRLASNTVGDAKPA